MSLSEDEKIEKLADYMLDVVAECFEEEDVSTSDVIAALFLVLERTLRGIRKLQEPEDRFPNAVLIRQALQDLQVEFGRVPS